MENDKLARAPNTKDTNPTLRCDSMKIKENSSPLVGSQSSCTSTTPHIDLGVERSDSSASSVDDVHEIDCYRRTGNGNIELLKIDSDDSSAFSENTNRGDEAAATTTNVSSSKSKVSTDQERKILLLMLLAQVCALHDSTPKTFIIHVLSLYERGILDYENIEFLFDLGLVPKRSFPAIEQQHEPLSSPGLHDNTSSVVADESATNPSYDGAIIPFKAAKTQHQHANGVSSESDINANTAANSNRSYQVSVIREHLERHESLQSEEEEPTTSKTSSANDPSRSSMESSPQTSQPSYTHQTSSWAVENHPLSLSRYNRDFTQKALLASGSFGDVYHAVNKLDNSDYAIKRVAFSAKGYDTKQVEMVIREVQCLAKMDHGNVVRYYTSWLEPSWMTGSAGSASDTYYTNGSALSRIGDGHERSKGIDDNSVRSPDDVASRKVQRKMLMDIHRLVLSGNDADTSENEDAIKSIGEQLWNQNEERRDIKSKNYAKRVNEANTAKPLLEQIDEDPFAGKNSAEFGLSAWTFQDNSRDDNSGRRVDDWNQLDSYHTNSISTGGYGDGDSDCSEWTIDQNNKSFQNNESHGVHSFETEQRKMYARNYDSASSYWDNSSANSHEKNGFHRKHQMQQQGQSYNYQICLFIQMQLCDPSTLADWIRRRNNCAPTSNGNTDETKNLDHHRRARPAFEIFRQIVRGLAHVHSKGIMHRDLKPANIFAAEGNTFKIGDFGLSKMLRSANGGKDFVGKDLSRDHTSRNEMASTVSGTSTTDALILPHTKNYDVWQDPLTAGIGTASYAAPEQIASNSYGPEADIFSLGLILLELFSNFGSEHERATTFHNCRQGKLPQWIVRTYPEVATLVLACTKSAPAERPTANDIEILDIFQQSKGAEIYKAEIQNMHSELEQRDTIIQMQRRQLAEKDNKINQQMEELRIMRDELERLTFKTKNYSSPEKSNHASESSVCNTNNKFVGLPKVIDSTAFSSDDEEADY